MGLFKMELYKICHKKITGILTCFLLLFFAFYFWVSFIGDETYIENGVIYTRLDAIRKEKELSEVYQGKMDIEKAEDIIACYGWAPDWNEIENVEEGINDNFWNRYITDSLSTRRFSDGGPVEWLDKEDVLIKNFENQDWDFGYTGGWDSGLLELLFMGIVCTAVLVTIGVASVYAEEYSLKTADLVLSSAHGKGKGVAAKIGASLFWSGLIFVLLTGFCLFMTAAVYGTEGLSVSGAVSFGVYAYSGTALDFLIRFLLIGLAACWLHTIITLYFSAKCRQPFGAVISSLLTYVLPVGIYNIVLSMLRWNRTTLLLRTLFRCCPYYLVINEIDWHTYPNEMAGSFYSMEIGVCCVGAVFCLVGGIRLYCKRKVG